MESEIEVVVLTTALLMINHVMWNIQETKHLIDYGKKVVVENPVGGWWALSLAAFLASPILSNDGVSLLFVEPILGAFDQLPHTNGTDALKSRFCIILQREDAIYFLLTIVCSANVGTAVSALGSFATSAEATDTLRASTFWRIVLPTTVFSWVLSKYCTFARVADIVCNFP